MYNNFGDIIFRYGTDKGTYYNQGYYKSIKNGNTVYNDVQNLITPNGNDIFKVGNVKIRMLTLSEINKKLGRKESSDQAKYDVDCVDSISSSSEKGIYRLNNLSKVLTGYTYGTIRYWVASPYPLDYNYTQLCFIHSDGRIDGYNYTGQGYAGVRPVIMLLDDKVTFDISNDGKYFIIE